MFNNKIIVIIGASSGIGYEAAKLFASNGGTVYNLSRKESLDPAIINIQTDVTNTEELTSAISEIVNAQGKIDTVVYSAGFSMAAPVQHVKAEDYRYLYDVNLFGAIETARITLPHLIASGDGRLIFISSIGGVVPIAYDAYYSSSKAALNMFCEALSLEVNSKGVKVTSLMPGGTATDFSFRRKVYSDEEAAAYAEDMRKAVASLQKTEQNGMDARAVGEKVVELAIDPAPPVICSVGVQNKFFHSVARYAPKSLLKFACIKKYDLGSYSY